MHMWMWSGYSLGEFLFPNLNITTRWSFALTWIVLFFVALLFEGSKVYLTHVQKESHRKFLPSRSDERRNLLCNREHGGRSSVTRSQPEQHPQRTSIKMRLLVTFHQTVLFIVHNTVGYVLMLVVMLYNVYLILAVVLGMTVGYFLFGSKLIRIKMSCFVTKRVVICTPECDDTAEEIPQHNINSATNSESELFVCETRTCITPSHYYRASTSQDGTSNDQSNITCQYGAKRCPSKISKINNTPTPGSSKHCHIDSEQKNNTSVEDVKLLSTMGSECCKSKSNESKCCNKTASHDHPVVHVDGDQDNEIENCDGTNATDNSPDVQCSHSLNV